MKPQSSVFMKVDVENGGLVFKIRHHKLGVMFGLDVHQTEAWIKQMQQGLEDLKEAKKQPTMKEMPEWGVKWIFRF